MIEENKKRIRYIGIIFLVFIAIDLSFWGLRFFKDIDSYNPTSELKNQIDQKIGADRPNPFSEEVSWVELDNASDLELVSLNGDFKNQQIMFRHRKHPILFGVKIEESSERITDWLLYYRKNLPLHDGEIVAWDIPGAKDLALRNIGSFALDIYDKEKPEKVFASLAVTAQRFDGIILTCFCNVATESAQEFADMFLKFREDIEKSMIQKLKKQVNQAESINSK